MKENKEEQGDVSRKDGEKLEFESVKILEHTNRYLLVCTCRWTI